MFKELAKRFNPDDIYFAFSGGSKYHILEPVGMQEYMHWFEETKIHDFFNNHSYDRDYTIGFLIAIGLFAHTAKVLGREKEFEAFVSEITPEFCIISLAGDLEDDDMADAIFFFIDSKEEPWAKALFDMLRDQSIQFWEGFMGASHVLYTHELYGNEDSDWPDVIG